MEVFIEKYNPPELNNVEFEALYEYRRDMALELFPERKPISRESLRKSLGNDPSQVKILHVYAKTSAGRVIGVSEIYCPDESSPNFEQEKHEATIFGSVAREFRNQGIMKKMVALLLMEVSHLDLKIIGFVPRLEQAISILDKWGAEVVYRSYNSRLFMDSINWKFTNACLEIQGEDDFDYELDVLSEIPEGEIEKYCHFMTKIYSLLPTCDNLKSHRLTPEKFKKVQDYFIRQGWPYTFFLLREGEKYVAVTEFFYSPNQQEVGQQITGVLEDYQRKGLAKYLKAYMIKYIQENIPEATHIRTANSKANTPMWSLNQKFGFKLHREVRRYEIPLEVLKEKIS